MSRDSISDEQRVIISQDRLSEEQKETLRQVRTGAATVLKIVDDCLEGRGTLRNGCKEAGYNYNMFLYYLKRFFAPDGRTVNKMAEFPAFVPSFAENLYAKVFRVPEDRVSKIMPPDAEVAAERVLLMLNQRAACVLRSRLGGASLESIGQDMGITRERVRQIEAKAYADLRCVDSVRILKYGPAELERRKTESEEKTDRFVSDTVLSEAAECEIALTSVSPLCDAISAPETPLRDLRLSTRAYNACRKLGIKTLADFTRYSKQSFRSAAGIGDTVFAEVSFMLRNNDVAFAPEPDDDGNEALSNAFLQSSVAEYVYSGVFLVPINKVGAIMPDDAEAAVDCVLSSLDRFEASVVMLRAQGLTYSAICQKLGRDISAIYRIERSAFLKLRGAPRKAVLEFGPEAMKDALGSLSEKKTELADKCAAVLRGEVAFDADDGRDENDGLAPTGDLSVWNGISVLGLSNRAYNACRRAGIETIGDLRRYTKERFMRIHGVGAETVQETEEKLAEHGLAFSAGV